jgi:hypothetical protein
VYAYFEDAGKRIQGRDRRLYAEVADPLIIPKLLLWSGAAPVSHGANTDAQRSLRHRW